MVHDIWVDNCSSEAYRRSEVSQPDLWAQQQTGEGYMGDVAEQSEDRIELVEGAVA